jgi:hypothetical protein
MNNATNNLTIETRNLFRELFGLPQTRPGGWAVCLTAGSGALLAAWLAYVTQYLIPRPTFFSDPLQAYLILGAAVCGIGAVFAGACGLVARHERSLLVVASTLVGGYLLFRVVAEMIGY